MQYNKKESYVILKPKPVSSAHKTYQRNLGKGKKNGTKSLYELEPQKPGASARPDYFFETKDLYL